MPTDRTRCRWVFLVLLAALGTAGQAPAEPRIELAEFSIRPMALRLGESFEIRARAVAVGVPLGSFVLRTADDARREDAIPGFPLYSGGKYYVAENGQYLLKDNGSLDRDARQGAFAIEISTKGWREGVTRFAFFASRRPSEGPFVAARHDFAVAVRGDRVLIEDLGASGLNQSRAIKGFDVRPATVAAGEPVDVSLQVATAAFQGIRIGDPFFIDAADTLPGFSYDPEKKRSFYGDQPDRLIADNGRLDRDQAAGAIAIRWNTEGWRVGVHHFLLELAGISGSTIDQRSFAVKVRGPNDRLEVTVEESHSFASGTHFGRFLPLRGGPLLCDDRISLDQGRTWQSGTGGFGAGGGQLADGSILGLEYRCLPEEGSEGWYRCEKSVSAGGARLFEKGQARLFVPEAKAAMGHGFHPGPLFMRSIIERGDGSLVALMAGWFKSDTALCPYGRGRPYSRSYVCESTDRGATWRYLTTIGYDRIGSEGYNEGSMRRLPSGQWLAVLRTGNERDANCQDNPIMWSVSHDEGRTWSPPERTGLEGAYPSLAVLSDGRVAISYGRPGAMLAFSSDGGRTWTDPTCVDATPYSGYTDVVELSPGVLLVGFGAQAFLDPKTGERSDQLRLARVRYRQR